MKSPLLSLLLLLLSFATAQAKRRHRGHLPIDRGSREDEVEHGRKASGELRVHTALLLIPGHPRSLSIARCLRHLASIASGLG